MLTCIYTEMEGGANSIKCQYQSPSKQIAIVAKQGELGLLKVVAEIYGLTIINIRSLGDFYGVGHGYSRIDYEKLKRYMLEHPLKSGCTAIFAIDNEGCYPLNA